MSALKGLLWKAGCPSTVQTVSRRLKTTDVKDVVGWKFVERPSKLTPQYTGDLSPSEPVDYQHPQLALTAAKDVLEKSSAETRRVLSLEFARHREQRRWLEERAVRRVQRHQFDTTSPEATAAQLTARLRRYQQLYTQPQLVMGRHKWLQGQVIHMATQQRQAALSRLRKIDYKRFEWLLDQLDVIYRPLLPYQTDTLLTRKSGIRRMVQLHCDQIRQQKLAALRQQYDAQKPAFLEERRAACAWIAAEERALGLPLSVDEQKGELLEPRLPKRLVVPPHRDRPQA